MRSGAWKHLENNASSLNFFTLPARVGLKQLVCSAWLIHLVCLVALKRMKKLISINHDIKPPPRNKQISFGATTNTNSLDQSNRPCLRNVSLPIAQESITDRTFLICWGFQSEIFKFQVKSEKLAFLPDVYGVGHLKLICICIDLLVIDQHRTMGVMTLDQYWRVLFAI